MSTKRYKLLRNLPDSKPSDVYIWNDSQQAYYKDGNVMDSYWKAESVEDNPEWFEEIKPEEIKAVITLRLITDNPIRFPCFCIPTNVGYPPSVPKYKWEHAGIVGSLVRTSADYFEIIETNPLTP